MYRRSEQKLGTHALRGCEASIRSTWCCRRYRCSHQDHCRQGSRWSSWAIYKTESTQLHHLAPVQLERSDPRSTQHSRRPLPWLARPPLRDRRLPRLTKSTNKSRQSSQTSSSHMTRPIDNPWKLIFVGAVLMAPHTTLSPDSASSHHEGVLWVCFHGPFRLRFLRLVPRRCCCCVPWYGVKICFCTDKVPVVCLPHMMTSPDVIVDFGQLFKKSKASGSHWRSYTLTTRCAPANVE